MRAIKFRIWDKSKNEWVENKEMFGPHYINNIFDCDDNYVFQQFTGFKDSKDKEIFEGDILRWEEYQGWEVGITIEGIYVAQWDEERGQWMLHDPFENSHWEMHDTQYKYIVGNIMENKALLPCGDGVD